MAQQHKPLCSIQHRRHPWEGDEQIYVCAKLETLKGTDLRAGSTERQKRVGDYFAAKLQGDYDAAQRIVSDLVSDSVLDRIVDDATPFIQRKVPIVVVTPHPPFDDEMALGAGLERAAQPRNVIPHQYAAHIAEMLDGEMDTEIVQRARVGRTSLTKHQRFLYHPVFDGTVRQDVAYILVDDVCTNGGTLAALRSHILANGGTICSITTLAHGKGKWRPLALTDETWQKLDARFGGGLKAFWEREIGHDPAHLTEDEGLVLVIWAQEQSGDGDALIQRLRDHLLETAGGFERGKSARSG